MNTAEFSHLPRTAAWRLEGAYDGFEISEFATSNTGIGIRGASLGVEEGHPWRLLYDITLDPSWVTRSAYIEGTGGRRLDMHSDGRGGWTVNGTRAPELNGCLDVDFEASSMTNTIPVHRLALAVGQRVTSSSVYVRTHRLNVERLEHTFTRLPDADNTQLYDYESPRFLYHGKLQFAADGLVIAYPHIGRRVVVS